MEITIFGDDGNLSFFVMSDGNISICHKKDLQYEISEFILTQQEFLRVINFINESIKYNNE
jgi:hypothetical protein